MQLYYTASTTTPPRVARLCQVRLAPLVSLRKFYKSTLAQLCRSFDSSTSPYPLFVTPLVTRFHRTTCQVSSSQPALFPYHASTSVCRIAHVPAPSFRFVRIHISLDCGHRQHFPKYQILNEISYLFHLATRALFRCNCACSVLLSALACIRNDSPISFRMACTKINSADSAPNAYSSDSSLAKATVSFSSTFNRQGKLIHVTQGTRCALPCHRVTSPVSIRISRDVFQGLTQVIRFQCRYRQVEFQVSCSFQVSQRFLGSCQICKCRRTKFV